jgi:uracil phosphoribosyltransferase
VVTPSAFVSKHPLVAHEITQLRDRETPPPLFRALVRNLTQLLVVEALADAALAPSAVRTPMAECVGARLAERVGLVPILRAGLGMVDPVLSLVPEATVWHLGLYRDHHTLQPVTYYNKLPDDLPIDLALILDPMLATGGSAIAVLDCLKLRRIKRIKFVGLIAAPEGVRALSRAYPDVPIHVGVIDERLNEIGYIVPGLGDAGDRQFGTI